METQKEFGAGATVVYGLHGKCHVVGIETKKIGGEEIRFYKLEKHHYGIAKPKRQSAAIWIPVSSAGDSGLRRSIEETDVADVMQTLESREYYFSLEENWAQVLPKLEAQVRRGGPIGLAKVVSYLFVLTNRKAVPGSDILKFQDNVNKLLVREMSDATGEASNLIEERVMKIMRPKLNPDN